MAEGSITLDRLSDGTQRRINEKPRDGKDGTNGVDGKDGKDGADGAPGPAGPAITTHLVSVAGIGTATVTCDAGEVVVGGGGKVIGASLVESYPSTVSSWTVTASATNKAVSAYAVCTVLP
jgi:hypothetical protein